MTTSTAGGVPIVGGGVRSGRRHNTAGHPSRRLRSATDIALLTKPRFQKPAGFQWVRFAGGFTLSSAMFEGEPVRIQMLSSVFDHI